MTITESQFRQIFPFNKLPTTWVPLLNEYLPKYNINTKIRICSFLAQCGHESNQFTALSENLNYSSEGLLKIFKKYFNQQSAKEYHRKPEKIANRVYSNRMGNGVETSGDGWKYRGRGIIQLTGKNNYTAFATWQNELDLIKFPDFVATPKYGILSAIWYWETNKLNQISDTGNILLVTKKINGGKIGLPHRTELYNKLMEIL